MKKICDLAENYIKLSLVLRRVNAKMNRLPEYMFLNLGDYDFSELGLSKEMSQKIQNTDRKSQLLEIYNRLMTMVDSMRCRLYEDLYNLSREERIQAKEFFDNKSLSILEEYSQLEQKYLGVVMEIESAAANLENSKIRQLGDTAKIYYGKMNDLKFMEEQFSCLSCYLKGMISYKSL